MKTDMELQRDVLDEFEWEPDINAAEIGVTVLDGVVALTGHVNSSPARTTAERVVKRVEGVRAVANDIETTLPGDHKRTDLDIARTAVAALSWDTDVPQDRIQVSVSGGWITLEGIVDWECQRKAAEEDVRNLTGVRGVANLINVVLTEIM